ncbi:MAG: hypothetical protein ACTHLR_14680 [Rhizomicrobium sp.]
MPVTTVLSDEGTATIVSGDNDNGDFFRHRFSWSAAFAGAFVATAVTFFLLALGSGFGLVLTQHASTPTFLTLGAIYFFVAQAFGFAVGGHIAGRLIGPAPETTKEEEFRSAAHGLVVWALTVVATASLVAVGSLAVGGSAIAVAASSDRPGGTPAQAMTSTYVGYWVDLLFRPPPEPSQAWLGGTQYAQADTGNATDAAPPPPPPAPANIPSTDFPESSGAPPSNGAAPPAPENPSAAAPASGSSAPGTSTPSRAAPKDTFIPPAHVGFTPPPSLNADKAEVSRIIMVGMGNGEHLTQYDKDRIAALIAQDTGLALSSAQRRVDNAETRMREDTAKSLDVARKAASYASLWIAASLLFGAIVAAAAAMSARWEDDKITFGWPRREPR